MIMDILSSTWDYDWDKLTVETVEAMADDANKQVQRMLADPDYDFTGGKGKTLIYRLGEVVWACDKFDPPTAGFSVTGEHDVGRLGRRLHALANEIKERLRE